MKKKYRKLPRNTDYSAYRHPRWWPTWVGIAAMWLAAQLPLRLQWWLGKMAGLLALKLAKSRRHIAEVNIRLCFPELNEQQQAAMVRKAFIANGIGLMEIGIAWFRDPSKLKKITTVHGLEHFEKALEGGQGVLLLGGHYSTLDLGGSLATEYIQSDVMQRDHNNPLMNAVMTRSRERPVRDGAWSKGSSWPVSLPEEKPCCLVRDRPGLWPQRYRFCAIFWCTRGHYHCHIPDCRAQRLQNCAIQPLSPE